MIYNAKWKADYCFGIGLREELKYLVVPNACQIVVRYRIRGVSLFEWKKKGEAYDEGKPDQIQQTAI